MINIGLTALTTGTLISTVITNQCILVYISAFLSTLTLAFIIFQISFNPEKKAEKHRQVAKELWYVRERYVNLMADVINQKISDETVISRRDGLIKELNMIYKFAPITSVKAYKKAQQALKINEELTFSEEEIDQFVPDALKLKKK